ncbi:MAG: dockerin type I repeat-containing protein [Ruminococcus sp.]|nr:dockerin type I repeat-containing protein [Ruminococcus sp.]
MNSFKKILSVALVMLLALATCAVGVSAEEFTPSEEPVIYFTVPQEWAGYKSIFCHIWEYEGDEFAAWQTKKEKCTATDAEDVYSYNISKAGTMEEGKLYCVIFSADTGAQTYDAFMGTECFGDTMYCDTDIMYENPEDSAKVCLSAFWMNQDPAVYGPVKQITSIGNVVGTALPEGKTDVDLFIDFVVNGRFENAVKMTGLAPEEIVYKLIFDFQFTEEELYEILAALEEYLPSTDDEATPDETTPDETTPDECVLGDADGDGKVNVKDATAIQKFAAGFEITLCEACADVDADTKVNVKDATAIQKFVAGMDVDYPIGK